jgi:hypothetical protein
MILGDKPLIFEVVLSQFTSSMCSSSAMCASTSSTHGVGRAMMITREEINSSLKVEKLRE